MKRKKSSSLRTTTRSWMLFKKRLEKALYELTDAFPLMSDRDQLIVSKQMQRAVYSLEGFKRRESDSHSLRLASSYLLSYLGSPAILRKRKTAVIASAKKKASSSSTSSSKAVLMKGLSKS